MRRIPLLEKGGIITEKNSDFCTIRLRIPAGVITPEQLQGIAKIAKQYGGGSVHLTTRQTIEISHINPEQLEKIVERLVKNGTPLGSEKNEVVNITACPGTERCRLAQIETISLARELDSIYAGKEMPVKVRIAISGCSNSCSSERLNEIGITGLVKPFREPGLCTGCGTCVQYCREKAIRVVSGKIVLNEEKCVHCGMCVESCPFHILTSDPPVYHITVGGRRGRHPKIGRHLVTVKNREDVLFVVGRIIQWVYRQAWGDILLPDQIDDLDYDR
ncbi:MAG: 4Fe-4S binding protein, partial [Methanospirillaceae archaeon]|nr:4Fe-4S binding protein [Methanospirillaceae archaeon]